MMAPRIYLLAVFAIILAATTVHALRFPYGKTLVYKYHGNVKTGTAKPTPFASEFTLEGTLYLKHDTEDPIFINAYHVALLDVKTSMYNGATRDHEGIDNLHPIGKMASVLQQPFMMFYDRNGTVRAIQTLEDEPGWSKNMKMAMVSMLQLDLSKINIQTPSERQTFITNESTIHGDCSVVYNVEPIEAKNEGTTEEFIIKKSYSPKNCSGFEIHNFNRRDCDNCLPTKQERLNGESKRIVEIEKQGDDIIIKKLSADSDFNYLPAHKISDSHYVLTKTTFILERVVPNSEINLPFTEFHNQRITHDMTYQKPKGRFAPNAAMDVTHGRHLVDRDTLVTDLKKMLDEAVDYIESNTSDTGAPDWTHGQTINKILDTMSYMDLPSLELVFNYYKYSESERTFKIKNIFCNMIAQVGTPATSLLTLSIIRNEKSMKETLIAMMENLAIHVKEPSEELLVQLEDLLELDNNNEIKRAGILSFSTLIYRTFKHLPHPEKNPLLQRYLRYLFYLLKNIENDQMKIVYLMAMRNVEVGKIYDRLKPIIEGDLKISKDPETIRLLSIWAVEKAISKDCAAAEKLLWPIMTDKNLPTKLIIAAYDILIHIPNDVLLRRIYSFMVTETNVELRNYHHSTLENILKSLDPCKAELRNILDKIVLDSDKKEKKFFTRSASYYYDSFDDLAEKFRGRVIFNESSRSLEVLQMKYSLNGQADAVIDMEIRLHIHGNVNLPEKLRTSEELNNPNVLEILRKAAKDLPPSAEFAVDLVIMRKGRVTLAYHYLKENLLLFIGDLMPYIFGQRTTNGFGSIQSVEYEQFSQIQMTNDMGLPVILHSRVPVVTSLNLNFPREESPLFTVEYNTTVVLKMWRHGEHTLSTYNPISDAWHSVRRSTAMDISIPFPKGSLFLGPIFIRFNPYKLPPGKNIAAAFSHVTKDSVMVTFGKDSEDLKKSCSNCHLEENIVGIDSHPITNLHGDFVSSLTGRQYHYHVEGFPVLDESNEENLALQVDSKLKTIHEKLWRMLLYPQVGNSNILVEVKPSDLPASAAQIHMDWVRDGTADDATGYLLGSRKKGFMGSVVALSNETDALLNAWILKFSVNSDDGHLSNRIAWQFMRHTPGKQNYKICINAHKNYQPVPLDRLKIGGRGEWTYSNLTIAAGYTNDDECLSNDTMVMITMKGELSEEQKEKLYHDRSNGRCSKDINNPLYPNTNKEVPMTLNCINEAITYSSLRKYTINMEHKSLPEKSLLSVMSFYNNYLRKPFSAFYELNIERIDAENLKIIAEFPMQSDVIEDNEVNKTETSSSGIFPSNHLQDINNDFAQPLWFSVLDNTRFNRYFLSQYNDKNMKMCVIYPRIILTADDKSIPFDIPREWTLVTGDHFEKTFAIFAKAVGDKLSIKFYVEEKEVVIFPSAENSFQVMINGQLSTDKMENGLVINDANDEGILKLTRKNDLMIVHFSREPLSVVYSPHYISLYIEKLRYKERVCGLCGRLDGSESTNIHEIYTLP